MIEQLEKFEKRYIELEELLAQSEVVTNKELYSKYAKELSGLGKSVRIYRDFKDVESQILGLENELKAKHDKEFLEMVKSEIEDLRNRREELKLQIEGVLKGEDKDAGKGVIVEIRPGTGGDEAGLFAADLYRMYTKYADLRGWKVEMMSANANEVGGFKEVIFALNGKDAYKRMKFESGVHRVQRVPETEAQGRIHTSTATVVVLVEPEEVDLSIENKDLRIDTYRASGHGGQGVQKTDSAVRITHIPTNTVVTCQDERSQIKNRAQAMRILRARLLDAKLEAETKKMSQARRSQIGTGDRSEKIRTYNFPEHRVTDHRINFTMHRLEELMEGSLDELTDCLIKAEEEEKRKNP